MPLVLFDLPDVLLYLVLRHLDPVSMKMCCQTCRLLREIGMNEHEWKRACLRDFWWCFWDGKCCGDANNNNLYFQSVIKRNSAALSHDIFQNAFVVDSLSPRVLAKLTQQKQQHSSNSPTSSLYSPMVTSPFSSSSPLSPSSSTRRFDDDACPFPHRKTFNPYHPLHTNWYEAYWTIYYGKYTSYLQVLNSLENRELSAFFALGTFDHRLSRLVVSYSDSLIARYRQGENIVLKARDIDTDDNMELLCIGNDRHRIRRILEDMLEWAPPEIYARELFDMIDPRTRMHTYLPGAQVEIQWRTNVEGHSNWAWWRGYVAIDPQNINIQATRNSNRNDDMIRDRVPVIFPQHFWNSAWRSVQVSLTGFPQWNNPDIPELGLVGGIRSVVCKSHHLMWKANFERTRAWIQFEEELEREVAARAAQEEPATASNEEIFL